MSSPTKTIPKTLCYHCGDECREDHVKTEGKDFCCHGCKMVYEIINQNDLCEYYDLEKNPGVSQKVKVREGKFAFLDNAEIARTLIHFSEGNQSHVTFYLPQMHCSSCIWLLEQLPRLKPGILSSRTNFISKEVTVIFDADKINLRAVAELLTTVGYEPHISLKDLSGKKVKKYDRSRIYKIGVAGFCFGNIMLLSFPEYLASVDLPEEKIASLFKHLNLALALPVFFYCASEFYVSAFKALRQRFLNIDAPIVLAILITFSRSVYEILSGTGAGYLDSMSGIVFFMLIGRFFQDRSYQGLSFERDYTSYFPIGVTLITGESEKQVPVSRLKKGDRIRVHSHEIVPADGILFLGSGQIDYSFVTGESIPNEKTIGEIIYAGGRQTGAAIELEVIKEVSQSYLTQLWNHDTFKKNKSKTKVSFVHRVSRYFTYILFSIALCAAAYWYFNEPGRVWNAVTAILIVACPCALLLSATFTNGNMLAKLQSMGLFIKNSQALEAISNADTVVFDKTGTLSFQQEAAISYTGRALTLSESQVIRSLAAQSSHPLSRALVSQLPTSKLLQVRDYQEQKGKGSRGTVNGVVVELGSETFVCGRQSAVSASGSRVFVNINGEVAGYFSISSTYRPALAELIAQLETKYSLSVVSGDNNADENTLRSFFGKNAVLRFNQSPEEKLLYIKKLQEKGHKVIMVGDGLNDAGALQQSDTGIAISDDMNNFSPGCDAILDGTAFSRLARILAYCAKQMSIIYGSFVISILYNLAGLFYAVQGTLSPVIAAILMPASSLSIVFFTTGMSSLLAAKSRN
jgi:Cu+-exporting ATPase